MSPWHRGLVSMATHQGINHWLLSWCEDKVWAQVCLLRYSCPWILHFFSCLQSSHKLMITSYEEGRKLSIQWNFLESGKRGTHVAGALHASKEKSQWLHESCLCCVLPFSLLRLQCWWLNRQKGKNIFLPPARSPVVYLKRRGSGCILGRKGRRWMRTALLWLLSRDSSETEPNSPSLSKSIEFIMFNPLLFFLRHTMAML